MQQAPAYARELFAITKAGKSNIVADALSSQFQPEEPASNTTNSIMLTISSPVLVVLSQIQEYFKNNQEGAEFIK